MVIIIGRFFCLSVWRRMRKFSSPANCVCRSTSIFRFVTPAPIRLGQSRAGQMFIRRSHRKGRKKGPRKRGGANRLQMKHWEVSGGKEDEERMRG